MCEYPLQPVLAQRNYLAHNDNYRGLSPDSWCSIRAM
jgi:hypothetical protein